jgi:hypothetical protein
MLALPLRPDYCMTAPYLIPGHGISDIRPAYSTPQPHRTCYMTVPVRALIVAFFFPFLFSPRLFDGFATQYPELEYSASSSTFAFGGLEPGIFPSTIFRMRPLPTTLITTCNWLLALPAMLRLDCPSPLEVLTNGRWAVSCSDALDDLAQPLQRPVPHCIHRPLGLVLHRHDHQPLHNEPLTMMPPSRGRGRFPAVSLDSCCIW